MISEMDPGNSENNPTPNRPAPRKRSGQTQLLDVIGNHFEASNASKRARIEYAQEALKFKTLKYNDRRESMLKKRETGQKKEEVMVALLCSFIATQKATSTQNTTEWICRLHVILSKQHQQIHFVVFR